jgi:hypothetical protein
MCEIHFDFSIAVNNHDEKKTHDVPKIVRPVSSH